MRSLACGLVAVVTVISSVVAGDPFVPDGLRPTQSNPYLTDGSQPVWMLQQGYLRDMDSSIGGAAMITIDGNPPRFTTTEQTAAGDEFVLRATSKDLHIIRRVKYDRTASALRVIDIISNRGTAAYSGDYAHAYFLQYNLSELRDDLGNDDALIALSPKATALIATRDPRYGGNGNNEAIVVFAGAKARARPALSSNNNNRSSYGNGALELTYALNIPAGRSQAVMHAYLLRPQRSGAFDATATQTLLAPIHGQQFIADLSPTLRSILINWRRTTVMAGLASAIPEHLLAAREGAELVSIGPGTRLRGDSQAKSVRIRNAMGSATVAWARVAALHTGLEDTLGAEALGGREVRAPATGLSRQAAGRGLQAQLTVVAAEPRLERPAPLGAVLGGQLQALAVRRPSANNIPAGVESKVRLKRRSMRRASVMSR